MNKPKTQWRYWFAGMKRPKRLPKGCENLDFGKWWKEDSAPCLWEIYPRRWRVRVPTCKWKSSEDGNVIFNPHDKGLWYRNRFIYCPTCGKPVEIVKGGAK